MEGTSKIEHDRWMEKITDALRSFRRESQRKADPKHARQPDSEEPEPESSSRT
jgi:hypothetical protein